MTTHDIHDETLPATFIQKLKRLMVERPLHEEPAEAHRKNRNRWALGKHDPVINYPAGLTGPQQFIHQKKENRKFFAEETEKYSEAYFERCFWIINTWGGISAFKDSDKTRAKIKEFAETHTQERMSGDLFAVISSLSKLAAFWDYERFAVYDSRVIFSLNWLLFLYAPHHRLFPQPEGRNTRIRQYHMPTILALHGDNRDFYPEEEAFYHYCKLLRRCAADIFTDDKRIHEIEMFLFKEADLYICDDMQERLSLNIKSGMTGDTP